jgi:hypothetical protein
MIFGKDRPWGIYGDAVWGKFDFSGSTVTQRNPIAALNVSSRANAGLDYEITMVESGLNSNSLATSAVLVSAVT